jgi:hypothetical protein
MAKIDDPDGKITEHYVEEPRNPALSLTIEVAKTVAEKVSLEGWIASKVIGFLQSKTREATSKSFQQQIVDRCTALGKDFDEFRAKLEKDAPTEEESLRLLIAMLREETYDLDEKGEIKTQRKFIPLPRNLRFTFEMYSRALGLTNTLNVGDSGWDSFQKALTMRHAITHPRTIEDLHLTDAHYDEVERATLWFSNSYNALSEEFNNRLQTMSTELDNLRRKLMT